MLGYKVTFVNGDPSHGGIGRWDIPRQRNDGTWRPGFWQPHIKRVVMCERGYHFVQRPHQVLPYLLNTPNAAVWRIQTDDKYKHVHTKTKSVAARARLVRPIPFSIVQQREVTCDIFARYLSFITTDHAPIERVIAALRAWKRDDEAFDALPVSHNHSFNPVVLREHTYLTSLKMVAFQRWVSDQELPCVYQFFFQYLSDRMFRIAFDATHDSYVAWAVAMEYYRNEVDWLDARLRQAFGEEA